MPLPRFMLAKHKVGEFDPPHPLNFKPLEKSRAFFGSEDVIRRIDVSLPAFLDCGFERDEAF